MAWWRWNAARWIGAGVGLWGVAVLVGIATHTRWLVEVQRNRDAAVSLNGAVGLALGGLALALAARGRRGACRLAQALAVGLAGLSAAGLAETLFNLDLHLDWPRAQAWIGGPALHPGRISPETAAGFLLYAAALVVLPTVATRGAAAAERWLTYGVMAAGAIGLLGYAMHVEELFPFNGAPAMAPYTAGGLIVLGAGLWLAWRQRWWNRTVATQSSRILAVATLVLLTAIAAAGGTSAVLLWRLNQREASTELELRRDERTQYIGDLISGARDNGRDLAIALGRSWRTEGNPPAAAALAPPMGFSAVYLVSPQGRLLAAGGRPERQPALALPIGANAALLWAPHIAPPQGGHTGAVGAFVLRQSEPATRNGLELGRVVIEQPLPLLATVGVETSSWGRSGEMGLCGRAGGDSMLACFPQRLRSRVALLPGLHNGVASPMLRAADGQTGIVATTDFRGQRVLVAYAPIKGLHLGLTVKMDTVELFATARHQLEIMVPLLLLLAGVGLALLRRQMRPLVRQLVESRNQAVYNEARFRAAADSSLDGFYIVESVRDPESAALLDFRLTYCNPPGERLAQLQPHDALGRGLDGLAAIAPPAGLLAPLRQVVLTRRTVSVEYELQPGEPGPALWLHLQAVPLGDGAALTVRDISERKRREDQLTELAQNDALTGLPNRRAFLSQLEHAMESSRRLRSQSLLALLYLDVDRFKQINDRFGHGQGDQLLRIFGRRLRECVRTADTVARLGGDEFTVLLENLQSPEDAERVVAAIFAALRPAVELGGRAIAVATSIGLAYYQGEPLTAEVLMERADRALYAAKRDGRNRLRVYPTLAA